MKNQSKIAFIVLLSMILSLLPVFSANAAATPKVGDVIGNVLHTNIKTFIDGQRIPSYNINNKSAIILNDLKNYGFDVVYNNDTRTSSVTHHPGKAFTPITSFEESSQPSGTIAFQYVYTNIVAKVNGKKVESFNIKGYLAIFFEDLKDYGTFKYTNATRESRFTSNTSVSDIDPGNAGDPEEEEVTPTPDIPDVPVEDAPGDSFSKKPIGDLLISTDKNIIAIKPFVPMFDFDAITLPEDLESPPKEASAPAKPTNLIVVSDRSQLNPKLTWIDNATNETRYQIVRYNVNPNVSGLGSISSPKTWDIPKNSTSYIDYEAVAGKHYSYIVYAYNGEVKSESSGSKRITAFKEGNGALTDSTSKGVEFLGRGYNLLGNFASPDTNSLKVPVLDVKKMIEWRQVDNLKSINLSDYFENISQSAYDYCKKTTTNVKVSGGYMGFSASAETNFGSTEVQKNSMYLATVSYWIRLHEYQLADPVNFDWAEFVYPSVLKALNDPNVSPATILDNYGSHILTSVRIGGRLDYNVSVDSQYSESFTTFEASVKASFNAGFASAGLKVDTTKTTTSTTFNTKTNRKVKCVGGILDTGNLLDPTYAANKMHEWRLSLEGPTGTPTLCDFGGQQLKPIWELCKTQERSDAIKKEFEKRVKAQNKYPLPGYVTDFTDWGSNIGPNDYFRAGPNMNEWSGGGYTGKPKYLFYFLGENEKQAYTDIFAVMLKYNEAMPAYMEAIPWVVTNNGNKGSYFRRSSNINYDSKYSWLEKKSWYESNIRHIEPAAQIYIYGSKETSLGKRPIKKIEVLRGYSEYELTQLKIREPDWEFVCLIYEDTPFNFNTGVGGYKFTDPPTIYIRFLRG